MYLTSQEPTSTQQPTSSPASKSSYVAPLRAMQIEMLHIMQRTDLDDVTKAKLYNNALQRYLSMDEAWVSEPLNVAVTSAKATQGVLSGTAAGQQQGSPSVATTPPPTTPVASQHSLVASTPSYALPTFFTHGTAATTPPISPIQEETEEGAPMQVSAIIGQIMPKYKGTVRRILNSGKVSWDSQGRVIHNNEPIAGSNIGQLVHGVVTDNKKTKDVAKKQPGWGVVSKVINKRIFRRSLQTKQAKKVPTGSLIDATSDLIDLTQNSFTKDDTQQDEGAVGGQDDPVTDVSSLWADDYY